MSEITLYTNPDSRARMIRWALEELGADYKVETLKFGPDMKAASFLKINPLGKVPAIVHKGKVITESAAILCYLSETFSSKGLLPLERERADYYRWLFFAAGPLELVMSDRLRKVENQNGWNGFASHGGNHEETFKVLKDALGKHAYIAGERFTAADIYVGYQIALGMFFKILPRDPAFVAYWNKLRNRVAFKKAKELDDALSKSMR